MAKFRRLVVPGHPHHVTQRGVRRQTTFFDDRDYKTYLKLASDLLDRSSVEIWSYCLMPNHIHAVVVPWKPDSLAKFFGPLHKLYAQLTNMRYNWSGHLWQARYFSVPMDESHTLTALRYVELNPLRSGLVEDPRAWPWSSTRGNLGLVDDPLIPDRLARKIVPDWADYLSCPEDLTSLKRLRHQTNTGRPQGDRAFIDKIEAITGRKVRPQKVGRRNKLGD